VTHVSNAELESAAVPDPVAEDDDGLFVFAHTFAGYKVWHGLLPVQRITAEVAHAHRENGAMPTSLTMLRTALFGEARAERFVDFGGFGDDPEGWQEHRRYMRRLVEGIRSLLPGPPDREDENAFALRWLADHQPRRRTEEDFAPTTIADEDLAAAVALTACVLDRDRADAARITEALMRDRLARALGHLTEAWIETEWHTPIPEFRGVGPVDIVVRSTEQGEVIALIECKWSTDTSRDKIYEGAWDAVKLALATASTPTADGFLVTGAPRDSWQHTETADLFNTGTVSTPELWARPLQPPGPNGGETVGADCEAGGRGNMFTHAPEQLVINLIADESVADVDITIKASTVQGAGPLIRFAPEPEFPHPMSKRWLDETVPTMPDDAFDRLVTWLRQKRWTQDELERRVYPLREP
jgi:hypothetical protein